MLANSVIKVMAVDDTEGLASARRSGGLAPSQRSQKREVPGLEPLLWDDLRYLLVVAHACPDSGAPRDLLVNHTTVERRICALEKSLGVLLFERWRSSGFVLTAGGERLLPQADAMQVVYPKSKKDDLGDKETAILRELVKQL